MQDWALVAPGHARRKADEAQPGQIGAPAGTRVDAPDLVLVIRPLAA